MATFIGRRGSAVLTKPSKRMAPVKNEIQPKSVKSSSVESGFHETIPVPMIPVASSNIRALGYDEALSELRVEFNSGALWAYFDVPADIYQAFLGTPESKGKFFAAHIKDSYQGSRLV